MADQDVALNLSYHKQLLDKLRVQEYNVELRLNLLIKMLEEKSIFVTGEIDKRWPLFLKNDIGAIGPDGKMEGTLHRIFYNETK